MSIEKKSNTGKALSMHYCKTEECKHSLLCRCMIILIGIIILGIVIAACYLVHPAFVLHGVFALKLMIGILVFMVLFLGCLIEVYCNPPSDKKITSENRHK